MALKSEFIELPLEELHREAAVMKVEGWRFIQTHAVNTDAGIDLYYSFMKNGVARNYKVVGVTKDQPVPSITDMFLAAFVFENEARELFGVDMRDIAIDFQGAMYAPAVSEPMTIISPEQKAARDKARKAAQAKAAKAQDAPAESAGAAQGGAKPHIFVMTPERRARLDAKMATMSPEKIAKVEAALKAREEEAKAYAAGNVEAPAAKAEPAEKESAAKAEESKAGAAVQQSAVDAQLEAKIAMLSPDKAAKVRAALSKRSGNVAAVEAGSPESTAPNALDDELEAKIALLSDEKAAKVRAALADKAARDASAKGGE